MVIKNKNQIEKKNKLKSIELCAKIKEEREKKKDYNTKLKISGYVV